MESNTQKSVLGNRVEVRFLRLILTTKTTRLISIVSKPIKIVVVVVVIFVQKR